MCSRRNAGVTTSVRRVGKRAKSAGVTVSHVNGASPEKYLAETMGSGAVFADFDADGWVDLFVVDGGSVADAAVSTAESLPGRNGYFYGSTATSVTYDARHHVFYGIDDPDAAVDEILFEMRHVGLRRHGPVSLRARA